MKLSRKLVPAIAMLLVSAVMLSTASFAWFSMNTTVNATGMNVQAKAMGSLIITAKDKADTDIVTGYPKAAETQVAVAFADQNNPLYDATHDANQFTDGVFKDGKTSGLKTLSATERANVDALTGAYTGSAFEEVGPAEYPAADYYTDYVVYISSKSDPTALAAGKNLVATVSSASGAKYAKAVAVDFYYGEVGDSNFKFLGTAYADEASTNTCTVLAGGASVVIPEANDAKAGCIAITMRVYIDGKLNTLVNNGNWGEGDVSFDVNFAIK